MRGRGLGDIDFKMGFPSGSLSKESACNAGGPGSTALIRKIPWKRKWQPTLVYLPGKSHEQSSLARYRGSPWGHKESGMTERLHLEGRMRSDLMVCSII